MEIIFCRWGVADGDCGVPLVPHFHWEGLHSSGDLGQKGKKMYKNVQDASNGTHVASRIERN